MVWLRLRYLKICPVLMLVFIEVLSASSNKLELDALLEALRNGDSDPSSSVAAAIAHNRRVLSTKGGCHRRGPKVVNLGLPRTGTLSFVKVMENNFGVRACHQLPFHWEEYVKEIEIWRDDPRRIGSHLKRSLRSCVAFSDVPNFALFRSFETRYPSTRFVMTIRGQDSWLNSTEVLMKLWKGRIPEPRLHFIQEFFKVDNKVAWERDKYIDVWEHHSREVLEHFRNRILLLPIELPDYEKLKALSAFLDCSPGQHVYAHSHTSQRSKESNSLKTLSKKCIKAPKKCGF